MPPDNGAYFRPLTDKQMRFAYEYCLDGNATAAAHRAGYCSRNTHAAANTGLRLLKHPEVRAIIEDAHQQRKDIISKRVCKQTEKSHAQATLSIAEFLTVDSDGTLRLKNIDELTAHQIENLESVELSNDGKVKGIKLKNLTDALTQLFRIMDIRAPHYS